jgi:hypothetical protein
MQAGQLPVECANLGAEVCGSFPLFFELLGHMITKK